MITAKEVAGLLANKSQDVARHLLPNGKKQGNEWCAGDIWGSAGESLKVHLEGEKSGVWCDFATGDRGDLLDLWALNRQITILEAIKDCCSYLGIKKTKLHAPRPSNFAVPKPEDYKNLQEQNPVQEYLLSRGLSLETLKRFKIKERDGDIVFPYYVEGKLLAAKSLKLERPDGKKQMFTEKGCEPCLFGWHALPNDAREVTLCEGEIDAMSLSEYGFAALSIPFGGGSGKKQQWIEYEYERLSMFDEIYICMDMDEEGKKASNAIIERLGVHRCKLIELPMKDPNECLTNGLSHEDMLWFYKNAKSIDPEELQKFMKATIKVKDWINPLNDKVDGYLAPWKKTHKEVVFRPYELSVWTGINGHGKSQFLGHCLVDMVNQGAKICIASLEMRPEIFLGRMTKQCAAMPKPSNEYIDAISEWFTDKLWYINILGKIDLNRILEIFLYARRRYGIDVFLIDSFMMLHGVYEEDLKSQKEVIEKLCEFKNNNYCHIHLVAHPRKGADEDSWPGKMDVKGSGAITDAADNCFSVWRNKKKEGIKQKQANGEFLDEKDLELLKRPDAIWRCDKQRNGDWEGINGLWYNRNSLQYLERDGDKPKRYVQYAKTQD